MLLLRFVYPVVAVVVLGGGVWGWMMCKCCKAVRPVIRNVILDREESIPVRCDVMGLVGGWRFGGM